jgi:hypothetical protein
VAYGIHVERERNMGCGVNMDHGIWDMSNVKNEPYMENGERNLYGIFNMKWI